jgi:hypothetical protein
VGRVTGDSDLGRDMVGTRRVMLGDAPEDRRDVSPRNRTLDEPIAAAPLEVRRRNPGR